MADKIEKFEDLIAWQKARELTKQIYKNYIGALAKETSRIVGGLRAAVYKQKVRND